MQYILDPPDTISMLSLGLKYTSVSAYSLYYLADMQVATHYRNCSASLGRNPLRNPSTDITNKYTYLFDSQQPFYAAFYRAPDSRIDSGVWRWCDGAFVSMTFISNNDIQTP